MPETTAFERLQWLLQERGGKNKSALGKAIGRSSAMFGRLLARAKESGDQFAGSAEVLTALAKHCSIDPQWLISGAGDPPPGFVSDGLSQAEKATQAPEHLMASARIIRDSGTIEPAESHQWIDWLHDVQRACDRRFRATSKGRGLRLLGPEPGHTELVAPKNCTPIPNTEKQRSPTKRPRTSSRRS